MLASFDNVYKQLFDINPPNKMVVRESNTDVLRESRGFIDGFDYTLQTQVGCPGGCLFCYVPSGRMLTPADMRGDRGEHWGFEVRPKRQAMQKFAGHLHRGALADKTIYWSGVTDPYATKPAETRTFWQMLCDAPAHLRPRRIAVQTRFRPDRDVKLMSLYAHTTRTSDGGPPLVVSYSIGTDREDLIRAWERATPTFAQRIDAIKTLSWAGIWVVPTLSPFGLWNDLDGTLRRFQDWDIPYITCLFFKKETDSANTPSLFLQYLEQEYPLLLDTRWQTEQLLRMRQLYGRSHVLLGKAGFASLTEPHRVI